MLALCSMLSRTYCAHFNAGIISAPLDRTRRSYDGYWWTVNDYNVRSIIYDSKYNDV